jgi:hypothetical protein
LVQCKRAWPKVRHYCETPARSIGGPRVPQKAAKKRALNTRAHAPVHERAFSYSPPATYWKDWWRGTGLFISTIHPRILFPQCREIVQGQSFPLAASDRWHIRGTLQANSDILYSPAPSTREIIFFLICANFSVYHGHIAFPVGCVLVQ